LRIRVFLNFSEKDSIPIHYNFLLQSVLYNSMDKATASIVHNQGYSVGTRVFRYFTFSRLLGHAQLSTDRKSIRFPDDCEWIICSPLKEILNSIAKGFLQAGVLTLGSAKADITAVRVEDPATDAFSKQSIDIRSSEFSRIKVRTLSPVVAYSTMLRGDGKKYTVYFQPGEPEFERIVSENLRKKEEGLRSLDSDRYWLSLSNINKMTDAKIQNANERGVSRASGLATPGNMANCFKVWPKNRPRLSIIKYKGGIIKGYSALLELEGPRTTLQLALDAGLGSKNAQGFGCLEVI
jgi:CRISPR-associated endoribonuclease Cas6